MQKIYMRREGKLGSIIKLMLLLVVICLTTTLMAQVSGDLRSTGSTDWNTTTTWERYNGSSWEGSGVGANNPGQIPSATSSVFVQSGHTVTLTTNALCNDLHITNGPGNRGIIGLSTFTLEVNGKMRAYNGSVGTIPGTSSAAGFSAYPFTSSGGGKVSIVGNSRALFNTGEWGGTVTSAGTGNFPLEINITAGQTVTSAEVIKFTSLVINTGGLDMGSNRLAADNGTIGEGDVTINTNGTLISSNTGNSGNSVLSRTGTTRSGTFTLSGILKLSGTSPQIQVSTIVISSGSTIEFNKAASQNFLSYDATQHPGAVAIPNYGNIILSNSGNKTPTGNFTVLNDLIISGSAILPLGSLTATIGGNWTNYATGGFTESTSTVNFSGAGAQIINTTGGEDFFKVTKTGSGTLTQNSDVRFSGTSSELNISAGIFDAGANTLSGTASTALVMSGGTLKLGKLATTLPEFIVTSGYTLTGGTIELNGAGNQVLRGTRDYRNLTFSNSGLKTLTSSPSSVIGTITMANSAILDVAGNTMGGTGTNLTMTETSKYVTAIGGTTPDARGTYSLANTSTIEFGGSSTTNIYLTPAYANIDVSGSNVNLSGTSSILNMQSGTIFTVKTGGIFNVKSTNGFSGGAFTAIGNTNNPSIILEPSSTIDYDGAGQSITNQVSYQNLTLSGSGVKAAPAGTLTILGNLSRSGTHSFAAGTNRVSFAGTTLQLYSATVGTTPLEFYNLTNTNAVGLRLDSTFAVQNEFNLAPAAKLNLNTGDVILRSTAARTAYITNLGTSIPSANISYDAVGRFTIERYLQPIKSWRLLATPVQTVAGGDATSPTINSSWREGISALTSNGYGTRITGPGTVGPTGVDEATQRGSMKYYDMATNNYVEITGANLNAGYKIANDVGYYTFVRGDRGVAVADAATATTLRMSGKIRTGEQTFTVNTGAFQSVGNPFASQIDFRSVDKNTVNESFYVWNPFSAGDYNVGEYEVYVKELSSPFYYRRNGSPVGAVLNTIESGQAFFIQSVPGGNIVIKEGDKTTGTNAFASRETEQNRQGVTIPTLEIMLHTNDAAGNDYVADAAVLNFNDNFTNAIDNQDVKKISNSADNIAIKKAGINLVVERRAGLVVADTIQLNIAGMRTTSYRFEIDPSVLGNLPLNAFLLDKFLLTETPVSLTAVTMVPFSITSDAASRVADRFKIVFRQGAAGPLPVTFTGITASVNTDKTNTVKWFVSNEVNLAGYVIERSANGVRFDAIGNSAVAGNTVYSFIDASPIAAVNYYRVKAISNNGQVQYSAIVKLSSADVKPAFTIQPNPVINKTLHINFQNMEGLYSIRVTSKQGATVLNKQITIASGSQVKDIALGEAVAAGVYDVVLVDAKGKQIVQTIFIQ